QQRRPAGGARGPLGVPDPFAPRAPPLGHIGVAEGGDSAVPGLRRRAAPGPPDRVLPAVRTGVVHREPGAARRAAALLRSAPNDGAAVGKRIRAEPLVSRSLHRGHPRAYDSQAGRSTPARYAALMTLYLDAAATSPPHDAAVRAAAEALARFGDPAAPHQAGRTALGARDAGRPIV